MPVGRTHARNPTASPAVAQCLLRRGGLGPTVRAVLMRTTCVGGVPRICDTGVIRGVVHPAAVVRGVKGGNPPVGRTRARNPTTSPTVAHCLLRGMFRPHGEGKPRILFLWTSPAGV